MSHPDASVPVIGVERVSKRYGDYVAVHERSFDEEGLHHRANLGMLLEHGPQVCGRPPEMAAGCGVAVHLGSPS